MKVKLEIFACGCGCMCNIDLIVVDGDHCGSVLLDADMLDDNEVAAFRSGLADLGIDIPEDDYLSEYDGHEFEIEDAKVK